MSTALGTLIRRARHEAKLKPETMAVELGISVGTLFRYERGEAPEISVRRLSRIAVVTGKPLSYFFNGDVENAA